MRILLGIVLGGILTIGGAYFYDSHYAQPTTNGQAAVQRPLVNWDVVVSKWDGLARRARQEWLKVAG